MNDAERCWSDLIKKYALLISCTAVLITGLYVVSSVFAPNAAAVTLYEVQSGMVDDTVSCTGRVESADSYDIAAEIPCVVGEVYVQAGDVIKKGDPLFSIDVDATREVLASVSGVSPSTVDYDSINNDVTSPIDGIVSTIDAKSGNSLALKQVCAVISSSDRLQVKIAIHENKIRDVAIGQNAIVSGTAFAKSGYDGIVTYISPAARQQYVGTNSETVVDAVITLSESDPSLKPGLTAKASIKLGEHIERVVIPYEYVMQDEANREYVYVYKNGRAVKRFVETGKEMNVGLEIISGLASGEKIIVNVGDIIKSDVRVTVEQEVTRD